MFTLADDSCFPANHATEKGTFIHVIDLTSIVLFLYHKEFILPFINSLIFSVIRHA